MQQGEPVVGSYSRASVAAGRSLVSHSSYCPFSAVPWPPFLLLDRTGKEESLICDCDPRSAHRNVLLGGSLYASILAVSWLWDLLFPRVGNSSLQSLRNHFPRLWLGSSSLAVCWDAAGAPPELSQQLGGVW